MRGKRSLLALLPFAVTAIAGFGMTVALAGDGVDAAEPGEATYTTQSASIDSVDGTLTAVVSWDARWSGDTWPGYAQCRTDVLDSSGKVIGALEFETASMLPDPGPTDTVVVVTSEDAASAEVTCGAGALPDADAGYAISYPAVGGTDEDPRLSFTVDWTTDQPPQYQACSAKLVRADGTTGSYDFGLSVAPGKAEVLLTPEFAGAKVESVTCEPFTGKDGWGQ